MLGAALFVGMELVIDEEKKERRAFMPPPRKAAKKTAKHPHDKHHQANDLRRAYEHMGRLELLGKTQRPSAFEAVGALTKLARSEMEGGYKKAAVLAGGLGRIPAGKPTF